MILHDTAMADNLDEYGIAIPIAPSRAELAADFLKRRGAPLPFLTLKAAQELLGLAWPVITRPDLERVHSPAYIARLYGHGLEKELLAAYELINDDGSHNRYKPEKAARPLTDMFESVLAQVTGTYLSARLALSETAGPYPHFCFDLSGGMHHARYDGPSGFCLLNDILITARKLQAEQRSSLIWIIDVDAHKGDGSAELIALSRRRGETFGDKNPRILALSAHMAQGWPLDAQSLAKAEPGRAPLVPSDIDIPLAEGEESQYNARLAGGLAKLEELSEGQKPDLALVVDGVDVYKKDGLASSAPLALTLEQCVERDRMIFAYVQKRQIPSAWLMAGGYGPDAWEPTAWFLDSLKTPQTCS